MAIIVVMPKKAVLILLSIFLIGAIAITLFVVQRQTELRKKAAPATTMSTSPATVTTGVNEEFSLDLVVDTGANAIQIVKIELAFDKDKLQALSLTNTPTFSNITAKEEIEPGKARITVATTSPYEPFTGQTTAAKIRFKALAPTDSPIRITYVINGTEGTFVGSTAEGTQNSLIGANPATVTITGSGGPTPTPTTVQATATPAPTSGTGTPTKTPTKTPTPTTGGSTTSPTATPTTGSGTPTKTPTPTTFGSTTSPTATPTPGSLSLSVTAVIDGSSTTDTTPTFSGKAKAGTTVTVTLLPGGTSGAVTVDSAGNWTFTPSSALGVGTYTANITASDPLTGQSENRNITFTISSQSVTSTATATPTTSSVASGGATSTPTPTAAIPVTGSTDMTIIFSVLGILLLVAGTTLPFIIR